MEAPGALSVVTTRTTSICTRLTVITSMTNAARRRVALAKRRRAVLPRRGAAARKEGHAAVEDHAAGQGVLAVVRGGHVQDALAAAPGVHAPALNALALEADDPAAENQADGQRGEAALIKEDPAQQEAENHLADHAESQEDLQGDFQDQEDLLEEADSVLPVVKIAQYLTIRLLSTLMLSMEVVPILLDARDLAALTEKETQLQLILNSSSFQLQEISIQEGNL